MTTRRASEILRGIEATKRTLKSYRALRRTLLAVIGVTTSAIGAATLGVPINGWAVVGCVAALVVSLGVLAFLTFFEPYWADGAAIPSLVARLDALREELSEAGTS